MKGSVCAAEVTIMAHTPLNEGSNTTNVIWLPPKA